LTSNEDKQVDRWTLPLLGIVVVAATFLRFSDLGGQSAWFDEAATWAQVRGGFVRMIVETARDNYPPLYNLLVWPLVKLFGDAEWVLRLPAAILGIVAIPAIFVLGATISGRFVGLLAAIVIAFSGYHIWYSQEARMYTLLAFTSIAYAWALLRYLNGEPRSRIPVIVACVALLFSHPYGVLNCGAIALGGLLMRPRPWGKVWLWQVTKLHLIAGAIFLPWALALAVQAVRITLGGFWIPSPTPQMVLEQLSDLTGHLLLPMAALSILALVPLRGRPRLAATLLLLSWAIAPILLGIVVSLISKPIFISRYVIGSLPALALLAAVGMARMLPGLKSQLLALVIVTAGAIASMLLASPGERTDWRGGAAIILAKMQPGDCVAVLPFYNGPTWQYYARAPQECWLLTEADIEEQLQSGWAGQLFAIIESNEYEPESLGDLIGARGQLREEWVRHNLQIYHFEIGPPSP
jgi:mannosyltransferase